MDWPGSVPWLVVCHAKMAWMSRLDALIKGAMM